jgi:CubicO group peptidase (beta-lactamase class C family)
MSSLEQSFIDAIDANQIEGVLIEGRTKNGKRYSNALGYRVLPDETKKPLTSSDLLFLASSTKLLTTVAALQCCERGQLSLDADLSSQLSSIKQLGVLIDWNETSLKFEPLRKPVTLRHLLTHSSGLIYEFFMPKTQQWRAANPVAKGANDVEGRFTTPFAFQPGEGWMYGTGLEWAGLLVEKVAGMRLDEYFRKHIFGPVGTSETDISFFPVGEGMGDRMPDLNPNDPQGLGLSASMGTSFHDEIPGACYGGGGAYASAEAYISVLQSLLANNGKVLNCDTVTEMLKPQLEPKAKESMVSRLQGEWAPYFNMGSTGQSPDFGLGGLLVTESGDGSGLGKGTITWGGGCNSAWFIDPENEICGFVCPQLGIPPDTGKAIELKAVFRKYLKAELGGGT